MKDTLLRLYDWFGTHRSWLWGGCGAVALVLLVLAGSLRYNEDIMDFLPATDEERAAFHQWQERQSALRLVLIIEGEDEDLRNEAFYDMDERLANIGHPLSEFDIEELMANSQWLTTHIPDSVYDRFDSLFTPEAVRAALLRDQAILSTPGASMLSDAIRHDPLGLVPITNYQLPITNKSYAFLETPYGATETRRNAALLDSLNALTDEVAAAYPALTCRWTGAPVIAVGNARRIKTDTVFCIALSLVLIILLLAYAFPRRRDLWLILLAVSFGWMTGMEVLRLVTPAVSAVVLGIGSVLIGIAVNYPLHLLVHRRYTCSVRQTLDEVLTPLVVGNITTVGAFMALIPLQATAMRHLGIFAAAMLIGTIVCCIAVLPHLMSDEPTPVREFKISSPWWERNRQKISRVGQYTVLGLTLLVGVYMFVNRQSSNRQLFDSNMSHINYMTLEQRADIQSLENRPGNPARWTEYWSTHDAHAVESLIRTEAQAVGFRPDAFAPFYAQIINHQSSNRQSSNRQSFDLSSLTQRLSDDFEYIGLCCSVIVFLFLWLSFRRLGLALIAFVPMALSWVWIMAIMQWTGLQFNIVNIILATFIFGQGDDYTIFIVEGLLYEHRTGQAMLPQYRQSILLSALIMLVGIGILVLAVHPAMHSLGAVTLIGMTVVLLMAVTVPPVLFRLYTRFVRL